MKKFTLGSKYGKGAFDAYEYILFSIYVFYEYILVNVFTLLFFNFELIVISAVNTFGQTEQLPLSDFPQSLPKF